MKFTLATCNVLYESYYLHYTKAQNVFISAGWRARAFEQAFKKNTILKNCDIYCFQEWPYKSYLLHSRKNEHIKLNGQYLMKKGDYALRHYGQQEKRFKSIITTYCPQTKYTWLWDDETDKDGVLTLINKKKFEVLNYQFVRLEKNKKMCWMIVQTKQRPFKKLSLINVHLPLTNTERFVKIVATKNKMLPSSLKLVCGDFNYELLKQTINQISETKLNQLKKWFKPLGISANYVPIPTSIKGSGEEMRLIDYILFSPQLKPVAWHSYPNTKTNAGRALLIKHKGQKSSSRRYFSDHVVLKSLFTIAG